MISDIKIKEENLFCDNIKGNEIFPAQQVSKWQEPEAAGSAVGLCFSAPQGQVPLGPCVLPAEGPRECSLNMLYYFTLHAGLIVPSRSFILCVQDQYRFQNSTLNSVDGETLVVPPPPPRTQWLRFCMVSLPLKKMWGFTYYYLQNGVSIYCSATCLLKNAFPPLRDAFIRVYINLPCSVVL